jgi:plasmid stabilization system protein ParE
VSLRVVLSVRAHDQIEEAVAWLSEHFAEADKWHSQLNAAIAELGPHPERYPLANDEELADLNIREMIFGRRRRAYRVLYRIEEQVVRILDVRHHSRGPVDPSDLPI